MVKHTQTIRREQPTNCLSVFDHFVKLALKGLTVTVSVTVSVTVTVTASVIALHEKEFYSSCIL